MRPRQPFLRKPRQTYIVFNLMLHSLSQILGMIHDFTIGLEEASFYDGGCEVKNVLRNLAHAKKITVAAPFPMIEAD